MLTVDDEVVAQKNTVAYILLSHLGSLKLSVDLLLHH